MPINHFIELVRQMRNMQATHAVYPMPNTGRRVRHLESRVDAELGKLMRAINEGETMEVSDE